jgi:hypothetical protein
MNKKHIAIIVILVLGISLYIFNFMENKKNKNNEPQVCFNNKCFSVEVARTFNERAVGLMNRTELQKDSGMLFVFEEDGEYNFWMKNTLISLDMIWISSDKKVVFIKNNAEPCKQEVCESIKPNAIARYVLEINGGLAEQENIKPGDDVFILLNK